MTSMPLDAISSYTTPTQGQQTDTPSQNEDRQDTQAQKRKRGVDPPQTPSQQTTSGKDNNTPTGPAGNTAPRRPATPAPNNQQTPSAGTLPAYNVPQFTRPRSVSPLPSPTSEAVKRRKLQTQGGDSGVDPRGAGTQEQGMRVDDDGRYPDDQGSTSPMRREQTRQIPDRSN